MIKRSVKLPNINIILGPPGTGKTENLLRIVDRELKEKPAASEHIGFFSFTRKATNEARDRAKAKFNLTDKDLPHFRTLHSFGKRQLGMTNTEVMDASDYRDFSNKYGVELKFVSQDWEDNGIVSTDNRYIREINKARMKCEEIQEFYNKENLPFAWQEFLWAYRSLEEYKHKNSKYDYTDMLSLFVETGPVPRLDVVIIDEAQDLTRLQWKMCEKIWKNAKRVYIRGDDDQAIFRWAGADIEYLINMPGNVKVLDQSYRCPQSVHRVAAEIVQRIKYRRPKEWKPRKEMGNVNFHAYPEAVDVRSGKWLILATCGYMLDEMEKDLRVQGLPYKVNNKVAVKREVLKAIDSWNRINLGEEISVEDVGYIYSNLTSKTGVERGYKNMKSFPDNPERRYGVEELVMNH